MSNEWGERGGREMRVGSSEWLVEIGGDSIWVGGSMSAGRSLSGDGPAAILVLGIGKTIAHVVDFLVCFFVNSCFLLIHTDAVVFPGEVNQQGVHSRGYFMQPLLVTFPYK